VSQYAVSQHYSVTALQCHSTTVSLYYSVYYSVTVLKCHSTTVSQHQYAMLQPGVK